MYLCVCVCVDVCVHACVSARVKIAHQHVCVCAQTKKEDHHIPLLPIQAFFVGSKPSLLCALFVK